MGTRLKVNIYSIFFKTLLVGVLIAAAFVVGNVLSRADIFFTLISPVQMIENTIMLSNSDLNYASEIATAEVENLTTEQQEWLQDMADTGYYFNYGNFVEDRHGEFYPLVSSNMTYLQGFSNDSIYVDVFYTQELWATQYNIISGDIATAEIYLYICGLAIFIALAVSILFGVVSGQKQRGGEVVILPFNRIFNDILTLIIGFFIIVIGIFIGKVWFDILSGYYDPNYIQVQLALAEAILYGGIVILCILWLYYINCIAKRIKRGEFLRYTTIGTFYNEITSILKRILAAVRSVANKRMRNYILIVCAAFIGLTFLLPLMSLMLMGTGAFVVIVFFALPAATAFLAYEAFKRIGELDSIKHGLSEIRAGNLHHRIPPVQSTLLNGMAEDINNISDGLSNSVEAAMVSERMKTELITNVSHDLKTPLTSILGYVDLLSQVDNLPDEAKDYTTIIQKKSSQLSTIISDLFDLAKSSSGNAEVVMERLDLKKLIEQTVADLEDSIEASDIMIKMALPPQEVLITADGNKLSRVFKNLVDNALKYSLANSRVHIKLKTHEGVATAEILNISAYEMNFTEQEILQRFVRGDESRTTQGNGLGLSIAKSFTELCKGSFDLKIDGDMFKVIINFPLNID